MEFTPILQAFSSFFPQKKISLKPSVPLTVMILSPHPDDECIVGSLALRLMQENNVHVINVAVTLGSNVKRQPARLEELTRACDLLQMELLILKETGKKKEKELKALIEKYQPTLILAPHTKDHHPTHIQTGELLKSVSKTLKASTLIAWTEFWAPMKKPNILIEVPTEILELQMRALAEHAGEVARNPYHLRLPAWMMDNVRRGSELIAGKGMEAPIMAYGVLYYLQLLQKGKLSNVKLESPFLEAEANIGQIFKLILDAASGSKTKTK